MSGGNSSSLRRMHLRLWAGIAVSMILLVGMSACGSGSGSGGGSGGGGGNTAPSITVQPQSRTVTAGQTATFTVVASGTPAPTYQWQNAANNTDIAGANSASYSVTSTTRDESGMQFQVVVSNVAGSITSSEVTLTVNPEQQPPPSNVTVLTYHNDVARTGQNLSETILTTSNVNSTQFGLLNTIPVDGLVDAEPLYVGDMTIGGATHNVVFVVTEGDSVYAFDADTLAQLWHVSLDPNESPADSPKCNVNVPYLGIMSTPVIDLTAGPHGTIFVVAMSEDTGGKYHQRLHALDLTTGTDLMPATEVAATASGTGTGSSNGTQTFDPSAYSERPALLLLNGVIYTTWASQCDNAPYNGWVISYTESTLAQQSVLNLTANGTTQGGREGGIWMAGSGPAADSSGNIYFAVGNGTFDTTLNGSGFPNQGDYGNAFVRLSATNNTLSVADYFTMFDTLTQSTNDRDIGSGGVLLLPDLVDASNKTRHLAIGAGKSDFSNANHPVILYVVDRDAMGKFNSNSDNVYQEISGALLGGSLSNGVWAAPAYFNNTVYYGAVNDSLKAFSIANAMLGTTAASMSAATFSYPGATPSISANGTNPPTNGIVWAVENSSGLGVLHAYDASNLATELYNSNQAPKGRDQFQDNKFITAMIANGKVYVGTPTGVAVFGLLNSNAKLLRKPSGPRERRRWLQQAKPPRPGSSTPG